MRRSGLALAALAALQFKMSASQARAATALEPRQPGPSDDGM